MRCVVLGVMVFLAPGVAGAENLLRNPAFEADADGSGAPDDWQASGDSRHVRQTLTLDAGRQGGHSARLACTEFTGGTPAAHAMICQTGVPVRAGRNYRLAFWARGERVVEEAVSVAISDTSAWENCGLDGAFTPLAEWTRHEFVFRATRDSGGKNRLQIWFTSTGTLWLDDASLEEAGDDLYRPGEVIAAAGAKNLVPNGSFECGTSGWGSEAADRAQHWGGGLDQLWGEIDRGEALHGEASLRIALAPDRQPISYFDYYELYRTPVRACLAGNIGYLEIQPRTAHTLSVYLKAAAADTPALVAVRQFDGRAFERSVRVGTQWQRYELGFTPTSKWCYVLAGPDLRTTGDGPPPPERATLWLDAVQLEAVAEPSDFAPRSPVEFGLETDRAGNVFTAGEPVVLRLHVCSADGAIPPGTLELRVSDFFDREVWSRSLKLDETNPSAATVRLEGPGIAGFLRVSATLERDGVRSMRTLRLAVIPPAPQGDTRFGVNHAYPWPHLLDLSRKAGVGWVRDWSLKWQTVEPEPEKFDFSETDFQIDRPLRHDLQVLGLLPFPSANWSSSAPASVVAADRYPQNRARVAYAPRDEREFATYVGRTVANYRSRIDWWQRFNEPLYTDYSLPRKHGYDGAQLARWTKVFAQAVRKANPEAKVLGGLGGSHDATLEDFRVFFETGGLEAVDAVDIHNYPRMRPPETIEPFLERLNALMDDRGGRKPIWLTEYGYYADDEPWSMPMRNSGFDAPVASEQLQAEYAVRWAVIMFAHGVEKVFYHAGTCASLNKGNLEGVFYEYAGQPHKIYAAQAVLSELMPPGARFVKRLELAGGVRAYLFRAGSRHVAAVWAAPGDEPVPLALASDEMQLRDLMGRPIDARQFTPSGTPVYIVVEGLVDEEFQLESAAAR